MRAWWIAGAGVTASAWLLVMIMQAVAGEPLPPPVSISQYGVGPHGWVFSLWALAVAAAPCLLYCYRPVRGLGARWWLLVGLIGSAVMATVRTDPDGLQRSVTAKIHMSGAICALAGLPLGMICVLLASGRAWRRIARLLAATSAAALELLLVSASGVDTTGAGAAASWSLWQSVAVAADMLLLVAMLFGVRELRPLRGDPEPWWASDYLPSTRPIGPAHFGRNTMA